MYTYLLLSIAAIAAAAPTRNHERTNSTIMVREDDVWARYKLYGFVGCSSEEQRSIYAAFQEKDKIVGSDNVWDIKWHSKTVVDYFGPPSYMVPFRQSVQNNFWNIYAFSSGWWFNRQNTQIFCHDRAIEGDQKEYCSSSPGHIAVISNYKDDHDAMMFCDSWFKLSSLDDAVRRGLTSHEPYDVAEYDNRAIYIISAVCQKRDVCPWPVSDGQGTVPPAHRSVDFRDHNGHKFLSTPSAIKYYSRRRRVQFQFLTPVSNVDGYAWFAMAAYIESTEVLGDYPIYPYVPIDLRFDDWIPSANTLVGEDIDLRVAPGISSEPPRRDQPVKVLD